MQDGIAHSSRHFGYLTLSFGAELASSEKIMNTSAPIAVFLVQIF